MRPKPSVPEKTWQEQQLNNDISRNILTVLRDNVGMSTETAMRIVTKEMLANNPFMPPATGCPINDLPNELLAYIFLLGTQMEDEDEGGDGDEGEDEASDYADALDLAQPWDLHEDEDMEAEYHKKDGKRKGAKSEKDDDDTDDEEDEEEELELPFQVLVSHICRHWREIALGSPLLWTKLTFTEAAPFEKSKAWIQRSKGSPLEIIIDCTAPENRDDHESIDSESEEKTGPVIPRQLGSHGDEYDEDHGECGHDPSFYSLDDLTTILDIIVPYVAQWQLLDFSVSYYVYMHTLLLRLAQCPSAPLLEVLSLHHYEDGGNETEDNEEEFYLPELSTRFLIFNGIAPNLREVTFWGVHLDWERSLSFLAGLHELEFAYHTKDVRPSFATFSKFLAASPDLRTLTLCLSGPAEHNNMDDDWSTDPIEVLSLKNLVLCYHEPKYIIALMRVLCTPNVTSLVLDYDGADYTEFVQALTMPLPGKSRSLLAGLEQLKIAGLPCNDKSAEAFLDQLAHLQSLNLNCGEEEEIFFDLLWRPLRQSVTPSKTYCPNLHTIWTAGILGQQMKRLIETRKAAGVPIKRVFMSQQDEVGPREEKWIKDHVETLEFFEPSDSEEEYVEMDVDGDEDGYYGDILT